MSLIKVTDTINFIGTDTIIYKNLSILNHAAK